MTKMKSFVVYRVSDGELVSAGTVPEVSIIQQAVPFGPGHKVMVTSELIRFLEDYHCVLQNGRRVVVEKPLT